MNCVSEDKDRLIRELSADGLSHRQISVIAGVAKGTVTSRLSTTILHNPRHPHQPPRTVLMTNGFEDDPRTCKKCGFKGPSKLFQKRSRDGGETYQWQNICSECVAARCRAYWRSPAQIATELEWNAFRATNQCGAFKTSLEDILWNKREWFCRHHPGKWASELAAYESLHRQYSDRMYESHYDDTIDVRPSHSGRWEWQCYQCRLVKHWWAFLPSRHGVDYSGKCRVCWGHYSASGNTPVWISDNPETLGWMELRKTLIQKLVTRARRLAAWVRRVQREEAFRREQARERKARELEERRALRKEQRELSREKRNQLALELRAARKEQRETERQWNRNIAKERAHEAYQAPEWGVRSLDALLPGCEDFTLADTVPSDLDLEREVIASENMGRMLDWVGSALTEHEMGVLNTFMDCDFDVLATAYTMSLSEEEVTRAMTAIRAKASGINLD